MTFINYNGVSVHALYNFTKQTSYATYGGLKIYYVLIQYFFSFPGKTAI